MCSGETPLETLDAMATKMEAKHPFSFYFIYNPTILPDVQRPLRVDGVMIKSWSLGTTTTGTL